MSKPSCALSEGPNIGLALWLANSGVSSLSNVIFYQSLAIFSICEECENELYKNYEHKEDKKYKKHKSLNTTRADD